MTGRRGALVDLGDHARRPTPRSRGGRAGWSTGVEQLHESCGERSAARDQALQLAAQLLVDAVDEAHEDVARRGASATTVTATRAQTS